MRHVDIMFVYKLILLHSKVLLKKSHNTKKNYLLKMNSVKCIRFPEDIKYKLVAIKYKKEMYVTFASHLFKILIILPIGTYLLKLC